MKIREVRVTAIAFRDPPLLNASGIHEPYALRSIIEVEGENGTVGLGESYGDAPVLAALEAVSQVLAGLDAFDLNGLRERVSRILGGLTPRKAAGAELAPGTQPKKLAAIANAAFEVAFLDLEARSLGIPLSDLLGGALRNEVPFSAYLFFKYGEHAGFPYPPDVWGEAVDSDQIVDQARRMIGAHGFRSIKLKAGVFEPDREAECFRALRRAFPEAPLRIDPNANWSVETAGRIGQMLGGELEYYEDPVPGLDGMAELRRQTGLPLATNMVVTDFDEFRRNTELGAVQIVLADHHYWGGLRATQLLARMCGVFDMGVSMHSNSHLGISLMAMAHVAATVPNLSFACDTHYPWVEDEDEVIAGGKVAIEQGSVRIPGTPGLGVELDQDRLATQHELFRSIGIRSRDDAAQMKKYDPDWAPKRPRY